MEKKPLYRKENTTAHNVWRNNPGGHYRDQRNTKAQSRSEATRGSMHGIKHQGYDYTPLFRFLLSRVGGHWDEIFSEAVSRLDRPEPVFWMVAIHEDDRKDIVRLGESAYFNGLFVDEQKQLQIVNPQLSVEEMKPHCRCCTHTFNGVPFGLPAD
ncbi:hypothetical protein [Pseudomonas sp. TNT2022 ID642]|uniref:hypothetical protein n=1 Tax=Pseudomonas sp. TNT2022 ID642 TaxID=2942632 RepID=UPI002360E61B|nr:hypothetical protein [Pseudomonas sp. TNT2022 ID642]MDD1004980.1 hypothetical protein [Pseudomonas sp. TNT2022 ID642]